MHNDDWFCDRCGEWHADSVPTAIDDNGTTYCPADADAPTTEITGDTELAPGMVVEIPPLVPSLPPMHRTVTNVRDDGIVEVGGASYGWFDPSSTRWRLVSA